jgi:hypothetical protein
MDLVEDHPLDHVLEPRWGLLPAAPHRPMGLNAGDRFLPLPDVHDLPIPQQCVDAASQHRRHIDESFQHCPCSRLRVPISPTTICTIAGVVKSPAFALVWLFRILGCVLEGYLGEGRGQNFGPPPVDEGGPMVCGMPAGWHVVCQGYSLTVRSLELVSMNALSAVTVSAESRRSHWVR